MARESRTVLTIFVGSPGDVEDERKAVVEIVSELNDLIAPKLGVMLEVKGWESVVRKSGRPQDQINPFVDKCDYFIGIMWKKWGMAPDPTGEFSSGFEEEFQRACNLKKAGNGPEISMFFRAIPNEILEYGNESILKVVSFRKSLIDGYEHFFQDYSDAAAFTKFVRKVLTEFIFSFQNSGTPDAGGGQLLALEGNANVSLLPALSEQGKPDMPSAFDALEIEFARSVVAQTKSYSDLTAVDVARLRLIAKRISRQGNDTEVLGSHDANLIYANKQGMALANTEINHLVRAGLENLKTQYLPLWTWLKSDGDMVGSATSRTFSDSEAEKTSAISVLSLLGSEIVAISEYFTRERLIKLWLAPSEPDGFRKKVLAHLGNFGRYSDISLLADLGEDLAAVKASTKEAEIAIALRHSISSAVENILACEHVLSANLIDDVCKHLKSIPSDKLKACAKHPTPKLRLISFEELLKRDAVDIDLAKSLLQDTDAELRYLALLEAEKKGLIVSDVDAKNIIIITQKGAGALSLARSQPTPAEQRYWDRYKQQKLRTYAEGDLIKSVKPDGVFDWDAELALYASYFRKHVADLREALADGCKTAMSRKFEVYKGTTAYLGQAHLDQVSGLLPYLRTKLLTDFLSILTEHGDKSDLPLVRRCLDEFEPSCSENVLNFFHKFGVWEDVERVEKIAGRSDTRYYGLLGASNNHAQSAAKFIATVCKSRVVDLFDLPIGSYTLQQVLQYIPHKAFATLSNEKVLALCNNESDSFRRAFTVKVIGALTRERVKQIHRSYTDGNDYRWYNVIHWLDLGVAVPAKTLKEVLARVPRVL